MHNIIKPKERSILGLLFYYSPLLIIFGLFIYINAISEGAPSDVPAVKTVSTTNVTDESANLKAAVDPDAAVTERGFQLGETTSYGRSIIDNSNLDYYEYTDDIGPTNESNYRFDENSGIALDSSNNIYVSDTQNNRIQKFDSDGNFITKWGMYGNQNGEFRNPTGIALDFSNNIYVSDTQNNRIQKFDSDGNFQATWGSFGTGQNNLKAPLGLTVDSLGYVYVADTQNNRIQKFDSDGTFEANWGSFGSGNSQFSSPGHIVASSTDQIYVLDSGNNRIQKFDSSGNYLAQWGSSGTGNGQFSGAKSGIAVDSADNIYVSEMYPNYRIQKFDSDGTYITKWGSEGAGDGQIGSNSSWDFSGMAFSTNDRIYFSDSGNNRIQQFDSSGNYVEQYKPLITASNQFINPSAPQVDSNGNIFFGASDPSSGGYSIFKFGPDGNFLTKWGSSGSGDGQFDTVAGIALDDSSNVYLADSGNYRIQKFDSSGNFLTKWGSAGGGNGQFFAVSNIAVASNGDVFVSDSDYERIQKFDSSGNYITQWFSFGAMAVDSQGDVYVTNSGGHNVQKYDSDGSYISSFGQIGTGTGQFFFPNSITIDHADNIYVGDLKAFYDIDYSVQKFDTDGNYISRIDSRDSAYQTAGLFSLASGFLGSKDGSELYLADTGNNRVRVFSGTILGVADDLDCGTTYHYRAFATNSNGTAYGDDKTFDTDDCDSTTNPDPPDEDTDPPADPPNLSDPPASDDTPVSPVSPLTPSTNTPESGLGSEPDETTGDNIPSIVQPGGELYQFQDSNPAEPKSFSDTAGQLISWLLLLILFVLSLIYGWRARRQYLSNKQLAMEVTKLISTKEATDTYLKLINHHLNTPVAIMSGALELLNSKAIIPANSAGYLQTNLDQYKQDVSNLSLDAQLAIADSTSGQPAPEFSETTKGQGFLLGLVSAIPKSGSVWRSPAVFAPVVVVSGALVLVILLFTNTQIFRLDLIQQSLQLICLLLISLILATTFKQREMLKIAEGIKQQAIYSQQRLMKQRNDFIDKASSVLSSNYDNLKIASAKLSSIPEAKPLFNGLAMLSDTVTSLSGVNRLSQLSSDAPVLNLSQEISQIANQFTDSANTKNVSIKLDIAPGSSLNIQPEELRQLVGSTLDNALKHSPEGSTVLIKTSSSGKHVNINITDQGSGIPKDKLDQLFQPFTKTADVETYDQPGLGLSLYVNRLVAKRLGGDIKITNKKAGGAVVRIQLPKGKVKSSSAPRLVTPNY